MARANGRDRTLGRRELPAARCRTGVGLAVAAMQRPSYDDLTQRLAYTVLYDRMFFDAAVKDADRGVPVGTWVQKRIAEEHDQWLRGELRPVLREYFRRMPWRCISFPDDY